MSPPPQRLRNYRGAVLSFTADFRQKPGPTSGYYNKLASNFSCRVRHCCQLQKSGKPLTFHLKAWTYEPN